MTFAICIGCYRLPQFIELNVRRCRTIFGQDVPIILADDKSFESRAIEVLAEGLEVDYTCSPYRRSHFSGDWNAFVMSAAFASGLHKDIALKISQRLIPVLPRFRECIEEAFSDPNVQVALPGRPNPTQIARPQSRFYSKFGILTDVLAFRNGAITSTELVDLYRKRFTEGKTHQESLVECTWGWLLANRFEGKFRVLPELTNHTPMEPKIFLRKSQSIPRDYEQVARMEGMTQTDWPLFEWGIMEGKDYRCRPTRA